jgi:multidrug transporter EmrE-like cation transporter
VIRGAWGIVGAVLALLAYLTPISVLYEVWCGLGALLVLPFEIIPFDTLVSAWRDSSGLAGILAFFSLGALLLDLVELG